MNSMARTLTLAIRLLVAKSRSVRFDEKTDRDGSSAQAIAHKAMTPAKDPNDLSFFIDRLHFMDK